MCSSCGMHSRCCVYSTAVEQTAALKWVQFGGRHCRDVPALIQSWCNTSVLKCVIEKEAVLNFFYRFFQVQKEACYFLCTCQNRENHFFGVWSKSMYVASYKAESISEHFQIKYSLQITLSYNIVTLK